MYSLSLMATSAAGHEVKAVLSAKKESKRIGFDVKAFSSADNYAMLWNKAYLKALSGKAKSTASEIRENREHL